MYNIVEKVITHNGEFIKVKHSTKNTTNKSMNIKKTSEKIANSKKQQCKQET